MFGSSFFGLYAVSVPPPPPAPPVLAASKFTTPDPEIIELWGQECLFQPASGGDYIVKMLRDEEGPEDLQPNAALLILFGTLADSGFVAAAAPTPKKNDAVVWQGEDYRIFDVKTDWAGGTVETGGLWLFLERR